GTPWSEVLAWIVIFGVACRAGWTISGLFVIHRYKSAAKPLYPPPESIRTACSRTGTDALFCVSNEGVGPVTFGVVRPIVLLPSSFMSLDTDAQYAITCHELLHVRRRDWLVTLVEEFIAAIFWFHPAFWWLLAHARLAREQLVDAEVVRLTSSPESYIHA